MSAVSRQPSAVSTLRWIAALAVAPCVLAGALRAQDTTSVLRGVVTDTAGTRVPYALVRILPTGTERFTDARGSFAFAGVAPGRYRVQARQVGFEPAEVEASAPAEGGWLRLVLRPLAIRLDELTVTAVGRCTRPGPPDTVTSPELARIFAELHENARRFAFLADSYPFVYTIERTFGAISDEGQELPSVADTLQYRSDARVRYQPGNIIQWSEGQGGRRERVFRLPSLPDLADSVFHASHCFAFGGVWEQGGRRFLRVAFRAAERLRSPDIDGEADLDITSHQLRHLTIRLTRPDRARPRLVAASISVTPIELYPNVLVPEMVRGTVVPEQVIGFLGRPPRQLLELQRLLGVHFLRPLPSDSGPTP